MKGLNTSWTAVWSGSDPGHLLIVLVQSGKPPYFLGSPSPFRNTLFLRLSESDPEHFLVLRISEFNPEPLLVFKALRV